MAALKFSSAGTCNKRVAIVRVDTVTEYFVECVETIGTETFKQSRGDK